MKKLLLTIVTILLCENSFANRVAELRAQYPDATPFEILKQGFDESHSLFL